MTTTVETDEDIVATIKRTGLPMTWVAMANGWDSSPGSEHLVSDPVLTETPPKSETPGNVSRSGVAGSDPRLRRCDR